MQPTKQNDTYKYLHGLSFDDILHIEFMFIRENSPEPFKITNKVRYGLVLNHIVDCYVIQDRFSVFGNKNPIAFVLYDDICNVTRDYISVNDTKYAGARWEFAVHRLTPPCLTLTDTSPTHLDSRKS